MNRSSPAVEQETEAAVGADKKAPKIVSLHHIPESETLHYVSDTNERYADGKLAQQAKDGEQGPSFHLLPNSETLRVVKDPLKLK